MGRLSFPPQRGLGGNCLRSRACAATATATRQGAKAMLSPRRCWPRLLEPGAPSLPQPLLLPPSQPPPLGEGRRGATMGSKAQSWGLQGSHVVPACQGGSPLQLLLRGAPLAAPAGPAPPGCAEGLGAGSLLSAQKGHPVWLGLGRPSALETHLSGQWRGRRAPWLLLGTPPGAQAGKARGDPSHPTGRGRSPAWPRPGPESSGRTRPAARPAPALLLPPCAQGPPRKPGLRGEPPPHLRPGASAGTPARAPPAPAAKLC